MSEALVFDVSTHARVEVAGRDAARFLHNLSTNDVVKLPPDRGCEAFFCTAKAKVVLYTVVWNLSSDGGPTYWLDCGPGPSEGVVKHLDRHLISERVELTDRTAEFVRYRVVGPAARDGVGRVVNGEVPETPDLRHVLRSLPDGTPCHVFAHDLLRLPAYDLVCPRTAQAALWQAMALAELPPGDPGQYEVLRVEAGLPEIGKDLDENRFVVETGRAARAISYNKGCYLGQEPVVMARDRGHVNRFLVGLKLSGDAPAAHGTKVFQGDRDVGLVTSSVLSLRLGPIALAYVWRGSHEPGTVLRAGEREATVAALPFISSSGSGRHL